MHDPSYPILPGKQEVQLHFFPFYLQLRICLEFKFHLQLKSHHSQVVLVYSVNLTVTLVAFLLLCAFLDAIKRVTFSYHIDVRHAFSRQRQPVCVITQPYSE